MLGPLSQRILMILQLTRMALVFTAVADGACEVLLRTRFLADPDKPFHLLSSLDPNLLIVMALTSIGLYGFGMSLNDIIDRRRDSSIAAHRPLPSGRLGLMTAHAICVCLALLAVWAGAAYAHWTHPIGWMSFLLVIATASFITFYDFAGKYLVALGLLSLGMIRFLQSAVAAPWLPVIWHPLLLLNHVVILSTVCYHWEEKRPPLTRNHWLTVLGGLVAMDLLVIGSVGWRRGDQTLRGMIPALGIDHHLLIPIAAVIVFLVIAYFVRRRNPISRDAGQKLMLYGLLWLIVYDAAFVAAYVSWPAAGCLLALLPIAWWSVQLMRWWSKLVSLSQRPAFQRART
jgi:4-hydroxybenzoate polyprenyltransferase